MTTLLCRLFLRGRDPSTPTGRRAYGTMAGAVGIALNLLLAAGKFIVGVLSGALSVQADAVNNLSDAGSQIISLVSFRIAARPADREHPFGHARIEYVASMIVSFAILLVGWELLTGSVQDPAPRTDLLPLAVRHRAGRFGAGQAVDVLL